MTQIHETDLGFMKKTEKQLDDIALNQRGQVGHIAFGYEIRSTEVLKKHGYKAVWIRSLGMGNCGRLVLVGLNPAKKKILEKGFAKWISRELGASEALAQHVADAACVVKYGKEEDVLKYVLDNHGNPSWDAFHGIGKGVWSWHKDHKMPEKPDLSAPRLDACAKIIARMK